MSQQRNMFQMKEQDKTSEEQLNEVEMGNLLEKKFKLMIKKMIKELGRIVDKQNEKLELFFFFYKLELLNKELENTDLAKRFVQFFQ